MNLFAVIPAFNEERNIADVVNEVKKHIRFDYKTVQNFEDEKGEDQAALKSYIEINGSVIIRLGVK